MEKLSGRDKDRKRMRAKEKRGRQHSLYVCERIALRCIMTTEALEDQMDSSTQISLTHEFGRCKESFNQFESLSWLILSGTKDKQKEIWLYNSYVDFVAHLYEFYLRCIKKDRRYPNKPDGKETSQIINEEVLRLHRIRRERILRGDAPSWENDISYYEAEVPNEFGHEFRNVRNLRAHCGSERASFDLADFYRKYHRFIVLLYQEAQWLWDTKEADEYDWKEIGRFAAMFYKKTESSERGG